jgi:hypothetical protein
LLLDEDEVEEEGVLLEEGFVEVWVEEDAGAVLLEAGVVEVDVEVEAVVVVLLAAVTVDAELALLTDAEADEEELELLEDESEIFIVEIT